VEVAEALALALDAEAFALALDVEALTLALDAEALELASALDQDCRRGSGSRFLTLYWYKFVAGRA
jgi:hypothetical protein